MSANFTPILGGYRQPGAFKFWCQKVLPLVYDDSLSYYELLCKVVDYINNLIKDDNTVVEDLTNLAEYVNTYFATMDISEELSEALDEMAESGRLDAVIGNYVNPALAQMESYNNETRTAVNQLIENQNNEISSIRKQVGSPLVASTVSGMNNTDRVYVYTGSEAGYTAGNWYYYNGSEWVSGGVYNSNGTQTDKTLTLSDHPADAGAVGTLKGITLESGYPYFTVESGGIYQETGINYTDPDRARTGFIPVLPGSVITITNNTSAAGIGVWEFASNATTTEDANVPLLFTSLTNRRNVYTVGNSCFFIRLMVVAPLDSTTGNIAVYAPVSPVVTPEMFRKDITTTDKEMLQSAFNFAFSHKCNIAIDRMYTLLPGEYILLNKYPSVSSERYTTIVYGLTGCKKCCGITKNSSGYVFIANDSYAFSGDFVFENLTFISTERANTTVFDMNRLMRITVTKCSFLNVDCVAQNYAHASLPSNRDHYWQSVTFRDCFVLGGYGYAFVGTGCYDVIFDRVLIEHRDGGILFQKDASYSGNPYYMSCRKLRITNCCIEGISGKYVTSVVDGVPTCGCAIRITNPLSVTVDSCYFEQNYKNIVADSNDAEKHYNMHVSNCWLSGLFYKNRYGTLTEYSDIVDDTCIVTVLSANIETLVTGCASERGGIVNVLPDNTIKVVYISNTIDETATGEYDYMSYTFDATNNSWSGNNAYQTQVITGVNINEAYCLEPVYERMG